VHKRSFIVVLTNNDINILSHEVLRLNLISFRVVTKRFALLFEKRNTFARNPMDIFKVTTKVATLCKCLFTLWAGKRALTCVLTEVISQIATFFKN
jgi:hypothetical protein